jgi:hypothetical protein
MYFTLGISAASAAACADLTRAALGTDPRALPIPGPATVAWQSADGRAAIIRWGNPGAGGTGTEPGNEAGSYADTIWARGDRLHAHTGIARPDPVYVAELTGAVMVSDRASWAAVVAGRLTATGAPSEPDPVMLAAFLNTGYPIGTSTPYRGVRALGAAAKLGAGAGIALIEHSQESSNSQYHNDPGTPAGNTRNASTGTLAAAGGSGKSSTAVAGALVDAVAPLAGARVPVELSLTGGKDSRLIAAALTAAKVPFRARTHGAADHPDVVVAGKIAGLLGIEHTVVTPKPPAAATPDDVLTRLRCGVLVADGMLSAFENTGRPDPAFAADPIQVGGHGGELLRGGYATYSRNPARGAVQFRRLTTRRLRLLRPGAAATYLSSLSPWAVRFARAPLATLDDFYLVNRAGRWSAAARQAYLLRSDLVQPFFDEGVVRTARAMPLKDRVSGQLHRDLVGELCPDLVGIPLAGRGPASSDWRRSYGDDIATFLRGYVLDAGPALFDIVSKRAAERVLALPHTDREVVWSLATLAALLSGDWLNARTGAASR